MRAVYTFEVCKFDLKYQFQKNELKTINLMITTHLHEAL